MRPHDALRAPVSTSARIRKSYGRILALLESEGCARLKVGTIENDPRGLHFAQPALACFDRTLAYATGLANVRAIQFPRTPGNARY